MYYSHSRYDVNTGAYTGTASTTFLQNPNNSNFTGGTYTGTWFQWEFFEKVKVSQLRIAGQPIHNRGGSPEKVRLLGSNDGSTWYSLGNESSFNGTDYQRDNITVGNDTLMCGKFAEQTIEEPGSYKYYRLIAHTIINSHNNNTTIAHNIVELVISEVELIGSVVFSSNDASLNHITDVDTLSSPPTNGQALVWDNTAGMWKPGDVTNTNVISDLGDVNTSGATNNQALVWSSATSEWVPGNTTSAINDLTDVNTSGATSGQALIWNGSTWTPGLGGAFSKNGSNAYYNDGNVGIGTTTPGSKLTVAGAGEFTISDSNNSSVVSPLPVLSLGRPGSIGNTHNNYAALSIGRWQETNYDSRTSLSINLAHGDSSNPMNSTHGKEVMFLRSDGNVGISNSNPSQALDVNGIILGGNARIGNATMSSSYASYGHKSLTGNNQYALIQTNTGSTRLNASSGQILDFRVDNDVKMTVAANGNVGIGTTTPSTKLHHSW